MENAKNISNAILVIDDSVKSIFDSKIISFLKEHDFSLWKMNNYPRCNWVYVSLNDKTYMPGIPGIPVTSVLGNHAITIEEFNAIYDIFEKYKDLGVIHMTKEEEESSKQSRLIADEKRKAYFKELSYDEYLSRCKEFVIKVVGEQEPEKYIDSFMKKEEDLFRQNYNNHEYPDMDGYAISLMYERYETDK